MNNECEANVICLPFAENKTKYNQKQNGQTILLGQDMIPLNEKFMKIISIHKVADGKLAMATSTQIP